MGDETDRLAIVDVMINYGAAVDERDRERYANCFVEDVEIVGFGDGTIHGREDWLTYVWTALEKYRATQHLMGSPLVSITDTEATARTDVQATHFLISGQSAPFILYATYLTQFHRLAGHWKIRRHELVVRGIHGG